MGATDVEMKKTRNARRVRVGVVSSDKGDKTIRVVCQFLVKHPKYGKLIRRRTVLYAHDETNQAKSGDRVRLMECGPVSKMKRWRLVDVLHRV